MAFLFIRSNCRCSWKYCEVYKWNNKQNFGSERTQILQKQKQQVVSVMDLPLSKVFGVSFSFREQ